MRIFLIWLNATELFHYDKHSLIDKNVYISSAASTCRREVWGSWIKSQATRTTGDTFEGPATCPFSPAMFVSLFLLRKSKPLGMCYYNNLDVVTSLH